MDSGIVFHNLNGSGSALAVMLEMIEIAAVWGRSRPVLLTVHRPSLGNYYRSVWRRPCIEAESCLLTTTPQFFNTQPVCSAMNLKSSAPCSTASRSYSTTSTSSRM
jgi:hypothetical protein